MGETPETLAQGRGEVGSFIGRRITDATGTAAASGSIPFIDSNSQLTEDNDNLAWDATNNTLEPNAIDMGEITDPGAAGSARVTLFAVDVSGSTALWARFPSGAAQQIAIEQ
jgi:hypothetical protein